jgi:aryl-alcohol dehydrogenase-like predicted oxidoreductase
VGLRSRREGEQRILGAFTEAGGNFLDTANAYHAGQSEEIVGSFLGPGRDRWGLPRSGQSWQRLECYEGHAS